MNCVTPFVMGFSTWCGALPDWPAHARDFPCILVVICAWQPDTGSLWVSVNERDPLGDHDPPDYMTAVRKEVFYGFPLNYYSRHVDDRVKP